MNYKDAVGKQIARLLNDNNKSQNWLAAKVGVSTQTMSHYMNGRNQPSVSFLGSVADVFGCSVDYLMGRTSSPNPWDATAMDELGLSSTAVSVVRGESPHQSELLRGLKVDAKGRSVVEENLQNLDGWKDDIHKVACALLEDKDFEFALLKLRRACEFGTAKYQIAEDKRVINALLAEDSSIDLLPDGKFAVSKEAVGLYLKGAVVQTLEKAVANVIKQAERVLG